MGWSLALSLGAGALQAQQTNQVEQLQEQLRQLRESFQKVQEQYQHQFETLQQQINQLQPTSAPPAMVQTILPPVTAQSTNAEQKRIEAELAAKLGFFTGPTSPPSAPPPAALESKPWSPSQPISVARAGSAYMNVSFDALTDFGWSTASDPSAQLDLGDHDPIQRGFSLRNAEIAVDGAVDPYFKGFGNIVFKLDKDQSTEVEMEETYLQSVALPGESPGQGRSVLCQFRSSKLAASASRGLS